MLLWSLSALANPFLRDGVVWRPSSEWVEPSSLPAEFAQLRGLLAQSEDWPLVYTDAVSSQETMRGPLGGTNGDLKGLLPLMERSSLRLTPRQSGWWTAAWHVHAEDEHGHWQQGMVRHLQQADGTEAILVERRRWYVLDTPMYSSEKYEEHTIIEKNIVLYRAGVPVAFYQHATDLETNPRYTAQQWHAQAFQDPDWAALPTHPDARTSEIVQVFLYEEDGSLGRIEAFEILQAGQIRHRTYTPHPAEPQAPD